MKAPTTKTWLIAFITVNIIGFWAFVIFSFFREAPVSPKIGDETEILFASATLVLTVLTIFLAILAVVGWYDIRSYASQVAGDRVKSLKDEEILPMAEKRLEIAEEAMEAWRKAADERISAGIKEAEERLEKKFSFRVDARGGSMHLHLFHTIQGEIDPQEVLDIAIDLNRSALDSLEKDDERWWGVVNNLGLAYALRGRREDGEEAIRLAEDLARKNRELQDPDITDTWARILLQYPEHLQDPERKLKDLKAILEEVVEEGAKIYREEAKKQLQQLKTVAPSLF